MKPTIAILAVLILLPGFADSGQAQQQKQMKPEPKNKVDNQDYTYFTGISHDGTADKPNNNTPPDMPGINFPGKPAQYLGGFFVEKTGSRGARFKCPESGQAVLQYYSQALNTGGWSAEKLEPGQRQLSASNPGMRAACTITVFQYPEKPGSEVSFIYGPIKQ